MNKTFEIAELEEKLIVYGKICYLGLKEYKGYTPISNGEFDKLVFELRKLDPSNKVLFTIGTEIPENAVKINHKNKMYSTFKCHTEAEVVSLLKAHGELIGSLKMDGMSLKVYFEDGKFNRGGTRGNGVVGENKSAHLQYVNFPKEIEFKDDIEFNGEGVISDENFILLKKEQIKRGLKPAEAQRNCVSGLFTRIDHLDLCKFIDFKCFSNNGIKSDTYGQELKDCREYGFETVKQMRIRNERDVVECIKIYKDKVKNKTIGYLTDGIVFIVDDKTKHEEIGWTKKDPKFSLAYKVQSDIAETKIKKIVYEVGKTGKIAPVAKIEKVFLGGANLTSATLHNARHIVDHMLGKGATIKIQRSNEVIPKFIECVTPAKDVQLPTECPSCGSKLRWTDTNIDLKCNNEFCEGVKFAQVLHFVSTVKMKGFSDKTLKKLFEKEYVSSIEDLYNLTPHDFEQLKGFKEKSAMNKYVAINSARELDLGLFLAACPIDGIGESAGEKIANKVKSITEFFKVTLSELMSIDGIGEVLSGNVLESMALIEELYFRLVDYAVEIIDGKEETELSGCMVGKSFIISGSTSNGKKFIYNLIKENGGKKVFTVKQANFLISNESGTLKCKAAIKYGVETITEQEFLEMI